MRIRPFIGTLLGIAVGVLAIIVWMVKFADGRELSHYLFPLTVLILEQMYPTQSIPVPLWYGGALFHWVTIGALIDLARKAFRMRSGRADSG